jgi:peptidyl-prolyl cis-trans isomerase SDCCAG10
MSTVLQPATSGKVVLKTTVGDIDVELWPKEAPKACRNFVQLCMEGYYDNCIFHRIIRKVCAQTGDPTATGDGGESAFGAPFDSEPHSRLRFMHRGLVAMAGTGKESNSSQFFFTLAETRWLDGKHTIFGKVASHISVMLQPKLQRNSCTGHRKHNL